MRLQKSGSPFTEFAGWCRFMFWSLLAVPFDYSAQVPEMCKMEDSQRRTPRFPFSAPAEIATSGPTVETQVTELSAYGCYLESTAPFPSGTRVTIRISAGGQCFEAKASVLYSQPNLGMGIVFRDVKPQSQAILHEWLRQSLDKQNARPSIDDFESDKKT